MARQPINIGSRNNDGTGDSLRDAFKKTNQNFEELYFVVGNNSLGIETGNGYTGSQGAAGYHGSVGYRGSMGVTGYVGSKGNDGTSLTLLGSVSASTALPGWPSSYNGSIGDSYLTTNNGHIWIWTGAAWQDGGNIQGPTGFIGSVGRNGYVGSNGYYGSMGYVGSYGYSGSKGYVGSSGSGYTGSKGIQGDPGGYTGSQGVIGYTGSGGSGSGTFNGDTVTTQFFFTDATESTSPATGAVVISGGLGVGKNIYASSFISTDAATPEVYSASNLNLTAVGRVQVSQSPFKVWNVTTTVRNGISASNGDIIYNTTTNKFQGYANGTWVDLN
jgi:hypothetical protein